MRSKIYPKARVLSYAWQLCSGTLPSAIKMVLMVSLGRHDFVCCVTWMKTVYFIFIAHYIALWYLGYILLVKCPLSPYCAVLRRVDSALCLQWADNDLNDSKIINKKQWSSTLRALCATLTENCLRQTISHLFLSLLFHLYWVYFGSEVNVPVRIPFFSFGSLQLTLSEVSRISVKLRWPTGPGAGQKQVRVMSKWSTFHTIWAHCSSVGIQEVSNKLVTAFAFFNKFITKSVKRGKSWKKNILMTSWAKCEF